MHPLIMVISIYHNYDICTSILSLLSTRIPHGILAYLVQFFQNDLGNTLSLHMSYTFKHSYSHPYEGHLNHFILVSHQVHLSKAPLFQCPLSIL